MIRSAVVFILLASSMGIAADTEKELQASFQRACDSRKFMGAVEVALNSKIVYSDACGWADAEWNIKNTVDTRFRTGSIAKQFTAAAVLLLHEQGKFSFTDPIGKYLPDLPESWRSATIHQLLTHTSGIPSFTEGPVFERMSRLGATPQQVIDSVRDRPLSFAHGTQFKYNNTGYFVLGTLVEKLSGISYKKTSSIASD